MTPKPDYFHIALALDADSQSLTAIEHAVQLAAQLQAELTGAFIEDLDLIRSAALPFSVEVVAHNAQERKVTSSHMERSLKARAEQARQLLAKTAEQANIKWQFKTLRIRRRGSNLPELLQTSLLLLPLPDTLNHDQPPQKSAHCIYAVVDDTPAGIHSLALARQLAAATRHEIVTLREPNTTFEKYHPNQALSNEISITDIESGIITLKKHCKNHPPSLLLIPSHHQWYENPQLFRKLQNTLQCPVVLIHK